jgi:hypothetical protein
MSGAANIRTTVLLRFLFPLAATVIARDLGGPFINGGIARIPEATETLAGFGLAWGLAFLVASPFSLISLVSLAFAENAASHRRLLGLAAGGGLLLSAVIASLATLPLGDWVLQELHGVDEDLAARTRLGLLLFIPLPLFEGLIRYYSGILVKVHRTVVITAGTFARILCSIGAVFALLPQKFVHTEPMFLPVAVIYAGWIAEACVIGWGYRRYGRRLVVSGAGEAVGYGRVWRFYYPLALVILIQAASRPVVSLFVARGEHGAESLAVLTIVYPLGHLLYGWLNELRNLPRAFRDKEGFEAPIRRLTQCCGFLSFCVMAALFWTPVGGYLLREALGLTEGLAARCGAPLAIFVFFPVVVAVRAYVHGMAVLRERTSALTFSGPARIAIILMMLVALPGAGLQGATLGIAALLSGFVLETAVAALVLARSGSGASSNLSRR